MPVVFNKNNITIYSHKYFGLPTSYLAELTKKKLSQFLMLFAWYRYYSFTGNFKCAVLYFNEHRLWDDSGSSSSGGRQRRFFAGKDNECH